MGITLEPHFDLKKNWQLKWCIGGDDYSTERLLRDMGITLEPHCGLKKLATKMVHRRRRLFN